MTGDQHSALRAHLFPGDGLEAVAFIACGRAAGVERHRLVARYLHLIPHDRCAREHNRVDWNAEDIELLMEQAEIDGLSLVKVHSHPQGFPDFSDVDDASDAELLPTIRSWVEADVPHGSAIMLPDGRMLGRYLWQGEELHDIELINVVGPDLHFWWRREPDEPEPAFAASQDQAFGDGTTRRLRRLRIAVVGASGTGSPTIEQLMRLGVGHIVPIDDDFVEDRNLNRITFATAKHAENMTPKVFAADEDIQRKGLGTRVTPINNEVGSAEALRALSECDVIFGCVDTATGRLIMSLAATHYVQPYFDIGILLDAVQEGSERGRIKDILGTIHYLVPGKSSLLSRGAITMEDVRTEELHKRDPNAAAQQVQDKYLKGLQVRRPAVVSVNMLASSLAVNDFLARLHPYRRQSNAEIASIEFSLGELRLTADEEMDDCPVISRSVGLGDRSPWLGLPQLGAP
jgi:ThiF family/Prokaryotic homologs of the JAB domain